MKLFLTIFIIPLHFMYAQIHEIGVGINMGTILGDTYTPNDLTPDGSGFGIYYKKNENQRIAQRYSINYFKADGTSVFEFAWGVDFNFVKYNHIRQERLNSTPYLIFEVAPIFFNTDVNSKAAITLPFGVGYKKRISRYWAWSLETKYRLAFTDKLDGGDLHTENVYKNTLDSFWYTGFSITKTFGYPKHKDKTKF